VIDYEGAEPVVAKGKSEPLAVSEAVEPRSRATIEAVSSAPLVGRADELDLLVGSLQRARRDREPQLVTVAGVPGIGKSRLVAELYAVVDEDDEIIAGRRGRCLSYGVGVSLWALGEIVKGVLRRGATVSIQTAQDTPRSPSCRRASFGLPPSMVSAETVRAAEAALGLAASGSAGAGGVYRLRSR
jgi:hypothetical protein